MIDRRRLRVPRSPWADRFDGPGPPLTAVRCWRDGLWTVESQLVESCVAGLAWTDSSLSLRVVTRSPVTATETGVAIAVWVVPGSSRSAIDGEHGGRIKVRVTAPPEKGRANEEVAQLLSGLLGGTVTLKTGMRGRSKVFQVSPANIETVCRKLGV